MLLFRLFFFIIGTNLAHRWATSNLHYWKHQTVLLSCQQDIVDKLAQLLEFCKFLLGTVHIPRRYPDAYRPHIRLCIPEKKRRGGLIMVNIIGRVYLITSWDTASVVRVVLPRPHNRHLKLPSDG